MTTKPGPKIWQQCSWLPAVGLTMYCSLCLVPTASAVTLSAVPPPALQDTGQTAQLCIALNAGGDIVAATQNDLKWNAACASMVGSCEANPGHGKDLKAAPRGSDGMRAIVISFSDMKPIPDGMLYCCSFNVELAPGECCPVEIPAASSSSPEGEALSTTGRGAQICLSSSASSGAAGMQGRAGREAPVVGADLGAGGQPAAPAPAAPAAPAPGGVGGAPPAVVVPGGAPRTPAPVEGEEVAEPQEQEPGQAPAGQRPAVPAAPGQVAQAPAATPQAPVVPPTVAPREEAPAAQPPAAAPPTQPKPVAQQPAAPPAAPQGSGCNCQIGAGDAGGSGLVSFLLLGIVLWARRRRI